MSKKGRAACGRPGKGAHPFGRRAWISTCWRVVAASGLAGMTTIAAGLLVAGPARAATGTAASTVTQSVSDATTAQPWTNSEMTGASAFDTATVAGGAGATPSGSVEYELFNGGNCAGSPVSSQTRALDSSGTALASSPTAALGGGTYSYLASYSGDGNYAASAAQCQAFTVLPAYDSTDVVIYDAQTHQPWSGLETAGASVYDKAAINSVAGFPPTGTVTYTLMSLPDATACAGPVLSTQTVTLNSNGTVPRSAIAGPLAAGNYEYQTSYSGDANHGSSSTYGCDGKFTVAQTSPLTATRTVVNDAATNLAWTGQEVAGASAYDTATVTTHSGIPATGTVTYTLDTGSCAGPGPTVSTDTVNLGADGSVPNSTASGPLEAGTYCYHVSYSGDANNNPSSDGCGEQFTVLPAVPEISAVKTSDATSGYVQPGQPITYTVTVTNSGLAADNSVTVTDSTPLGTSYVPNSAQCPTGIQCTRATSTNGAQTEIKWTFPMAAASVNQGVITPTTASVTFQAAVISSPGECTKIDNVADVDGTATNHVILYTAYPSLHLSLTAVPQPMTSQGTGGQVSDGELITYTVHWSNTGNADAVAATVTDTVPTGATYVNGSASGGGTLDPGTVTWDGVDMVAGTSGTLTFQVTVDHADQNGFHILNQAQVSSTPGSQPTVTQTTGCTNATPGWSAASNQTVHVVVVTSTTTTTPPTTTGPDTTVVPTQTTAPVTTEPATTSTTDPSGLAFTGGNTLRGLEAAGVVLAGGALLVLASRRGRRRKS